MVVEKGTRLDLLPKIPIDSTFDKLIELIRSPDLSLALALCEVCSAANFEELTEIFLKVFDDRKSISKLLKAVVEMEVSVTGKYTLFSKAFSPFLLTLVTFFRSRSDAT